MKSQISGSKFQRNPNSENLGFPISPISLGFVHCDLKFSPEVSA